MNFYAPTSLSPLQGGELCGVLLEGAIPILVFPGPLLCLGYSRQSVNLHLMNEVEEFIF